LGGEGGVDMEMGESVHAKLRPQRTAAMPYLPRSRSSASCSAS
jgi:hypothetical protein